jgi:hypothetical protein
VHAQEYMRDSSEVNRVIFIDLEISCSRRPSVRRLGGRSPRPQLLRNLPSASPLFLHTTIASINDDGDGDPSNCATEQEQQIGGAQTWSCPGSEGEPRNVRLEFCVVLAGKCARWRLHGQLTTNIFGRAITNAAPCLHAPISFDLRPCKGSLKDFITSPHEAIRRPRMSMRSLPTRDDAPADS